MTATCSGASKRWCHPSLSSPKRCHIYAQYEKELAPFSPTLAAEFRRAADAVDHLLDTEELRQWAEAGSELARQSWRSWEVAREYFRVSQEMLPMLGFQRFRRWAQAGRDLTELSTALAASYFRASPATLLRVTFPQLDEWVSLGRQLYRGTWRSASIAVQFFDRSPLLFERLALDEVRTLIRFVDLLCDRSYDLAAHCLSIAPQVLAPLEKDERAAFLRFAEPLVATGWADARSYMEKGPALLLHVQQVQRVRLLSLARELARRDGRQAFAFFTEATQALTQVDPGSHGMLLSLAEELVDRSPLAAMEFLKSVPMVLARIPLEAITRWQQEGSALLDSSPEGGEAYFRLESSRGEQVLESLSSRIELSRVGDILRMYCKALTGSDVEVHSAEALMEKGIGWVETEVPSTEGTGVFLPPWMEEFPEKEANFQVYKVYATHQAGHLEFGSFDFAFERGGRIFPNRRRSLEQERRKGWGSDDKARWAPLTDMERFFDLFPDRQLAADLFAVLEDARVDARIAREYAGIRRPYAARQRLELEKRPPVELLPLRQAFVENLVRASLDGLDRVAWPESLLPLMQKAIGIVEMVWNPQATVEDAAEAAIRVYELAELIPNLFPETMSDWQRIGKETLPETGMTTEFLSQGMDMPQGEPVPYESPEPVPFRGEFKPEMVQLLMRMRQEGHGQQGPLLPMPPEQLEAMLAKSVELSQLDAVEEGVAHSSDQLLANIIKGLNAQKQERQQIQRMPRKEGQPVTGLSTGDDEHELPVEPKYFYYDEWDFRAGDYRPSWCRVIECPVSEGAPQFFDQTLAKYATLASQTRRQFELLKPEMFRKIKRLLDGEEFDLDAVTEYVIERMAGHTPSEKVYWRRNKVQRDVCVAFLLDMSASTDEEIAKHERRYIQEEFDDDPRRYFSWWMARRAQELLVPPKRIIDLEKESIVLLIRALETIGDTYGIYGFSGYGRDNVEFYVVKDLDEGFSEHVKSRIDKIAPVRSTRMGPAIRHATTKLDAHDAKVRILFLVSDGRPQDHGYGRDRTEKEYAIHDTHMALVETKRKGIVPFCLTADRYGHDYLKQMCDDIGYAVVPDIESLPSRITTLYRRLTA